MSKAGSRADHQRTYHQKMLSLGMVRLSVWIPRTQRDSFRATVRRLEKRWRKDGLMPEPSNQGVDDGKSDEE